MMTRHIRSACWIVPILAVVLAVSPAAAVEAARDDRGAGDRQTASLESVEAVSQGQRDRDRQTRSSVGSLVQLPGTQGCVGARSARKNGCSVARAMKGPGPFLGSRAIALSPNGRNVYVASSTSDAVAIFKRNRRTGDLTQAKGKAGCVAADGAQRCGNAIGLNGPNSIAVSGDGRHVYVTSQNSNSLTVFARKGRKGRLKQLATPSGCISGTALSDCATARALVGPDVVVTSKDGKHVYVGSFYGNAVAVFARNTRSGRLTQPEGTSGCIAAATDGCANGLALKAPEGLAISSDGKNLYVASSASNAVVVLRRDLSSGGLAQATDGSGCVVDTPLIGCTTGRQLAGANAIALSRDGKNLYTTSLLSASVTSSTRSSDGRLAPKPRLAGCTVNLGAAGCRFGRQMRAPEGLVVSPDGRSVYAASFGSGAINVFNRSITTGAIKQKGGRAGCITAGSAGRCTRGRALKGVSSIAVSANGRHIYSTSFRSNAVNVFRRKR